MDGTEALKWFVFYGRWEFIVLRFIVANVGAELLELPDTKLTGNKAVYRRYIAWELSHSLLCQG